MTKSIISSAAAALALLLLVTLTQSLYPLIIVLCAVLHEAAHAATAKALGVRLGFAKPIFAGMRICYDFSGVSYARQLCVALSGSLFNLALALSAVIIASNYGITSGFASFFIASNLSLGLFNLLPIKRLDGGVCLECILLMRLSPGDSDKITRAVSLVFTLCLWALSVLVILRFYGSLSVFIICSYLLFTLGR